MPDGREEARRKEEFMKNRAARILQLSREWGVPTTAIYSHSKWGYQPATAVPDQMTYFTLKDNQVVNQKIDYAPVKGYPAGVYLPDYKNNTAVKVDTAGKKMPVIKNGGRITRMAQYGDILPIGRKRNISAELEHLPARPYQTIDPAIHAYFSNPENRKYIPANATLQGPEPGSPQYLLNTDNGQVISDPSFLEQSPASSAKTGFQGPQLNFNTAPLITGIAGAINNLYDRQAGMSEFNRLKRKQLQSTGFNPYAYGTGSQAIFQDGGRVVSGITPKFKFSNLKKPDSNDSLLYKLDFNEAKKQLATGQLRNQYLQALSATTGALNDRETYIRGLNKLQAYDDFIEQSKNSYPVIDRLSNFLGARKTMKDGGKLPVRTLPDQSSQMIEFKGPSHAEGGIPINYQGAHVEVEGGEPAYIDRGGDLNIFGALNVPGTGKKFKQIAKLIGKHEASALKLLEKSSAIMSENSPHDKFESLIYNSANLQAASAARDLNQISYLKDRLSALQERELATIGKDNRVTAQDGKKVRKPSMAERHNNPGNIKYAPWLAKQFGASKGDRASDGGNFAVFPDKETGLSAMKTLLKGPGYKSRTVEDAIKRWTNSEGYKQEVGALKGKKVGDLTDMELRSLMDHITRGEDSKLYDLDFLFTPGPKNPTIDTSIHPPSQVTGGNPGIPGKFTNNPPGTTPPGKRNYPIPELPDLHPPSSGKPPVANPIGISQIAPELLALIDRPDFVPGQRYEPDLYSPYQVSFQDRLNENQASFNRAALTADNNPAAASILAGQKYQADSSVLADQFRTNQAIANDITNKNNALLNDAQLKNLQLTDTQFTRQTQAVANTRQNIYNAVSSLAAKIGQNRLETKSYNAVSSLYPQYEFDQQGSLAYIPNNDQVFGTTPGASGGSDYYQRQRTEYDGSGNLKKIVANTPSEAEKTKMDYYLWNQMMKKKNALLAKPAYIRR